MSSSRSTAIHFRGESMKRLIGLIAIAACAAAVMGATPVATPTPYVSVGGDAPLMKLAAPSPTLWIPAATPTPRLPVNRID